MSPSSSSSSMGGSLALAAATAVAFSGSLVIFSLCRAHLSHGAEPEPEEGATEHALRPCIIVVRYEITRPVALLLLVGGACFFRLRRTGFSQLCSLLAAAHAERRTRGGKAKARRRRGERRVRFAADVVDNEGAPPARRHPPAATAAASSTSSSSSASSASTCRDAAGSEDRMMPANREALYRGMLRDRSAHRFTCSY
ncbi:uncharacterized protein [Miscanthus floridulus]|uniref:uncharacterized protein n=1 Tax=Miscanthus floridulus TaxID=154761 RepID=UPI003457D723